MLLFVAFSALLASAARAAPLNGTILTDEFSSFVRATMQAHNVSGLSLGILRPDGEVEYGAYGNRTEDGDPVTPATLFNIGSCSKAFLPASLGILMDDFATRKNQTALPPNVTTFDWETKMQDLLPGEWVVEDSWTQEKANLRDLLSQVTGYPDHELSYTVNETATDLVLKLRHLRAAYELREHFEYINLMYVTGAHLVTKYSGMDYRDFVEARIMQPLGMSASTLHPDKALSSGNMTQSWTEAGRRIPFFMPESTDLLAGPGGVMSNAEDMLKWIKMLLNEGVDVATNTTIIPATTFNLATTAQSILAPTGENATSLAAYGIGWWRESWAGHELIQHNGGAPGVKAWVAFYPSDNFGLFVVDNAGSTVPDILQAEIAARFFNLPDGPVFPEPPAQPPLEFTTSPLDISEYAGTYTNSGYGNVTLCAPQSNSTLCKAPLADFATVDEATGHPPAPSELYAAWPRFWSSHLRMTHVSNNTFAFQASTLLPTGYGADKTPFENHDGFPSMPATFEVQDENVVGFGITFATRPSWRAKKGRSVEDTADAWFAKVA
ncbi:beta-lactamase/transpeptidase-like protein [Mycena crocata]|nr:beta-lactamase/transpeptidase-like protein [Mycena crocata]